MAISLYDLSVGSYQQILEAVGVVLEKGRAHCEASGISLNDVVETRLYPDMNPFRFQVVSVAHHSLGAIEGLKRGVFSPPEPSSEDYAGLEALIRDTRTALAAVTAAEVNALEGKDMQFRMGDRVLPFTAEHFILSFSLPNFYFHAATTYDILRMKGVPIGKRHFMGRLRMKG